MARLTAFYHNNGYVQARIGEPEIKFEKDGIYINIKVDEGPQFKVGEVTLAGDLIIPAQQLMEQLKIGGHLVLPLGSSRTQVMTLVVKEGKGQYHQSSHGYFVFVPLLEGIENNG